METLDLILAKHPFFDGLESRYLELIAGCASNERYDAGSYLFREGETASKFFVVRHGKVAIETAVPGRGVVTIYTHDEGDVVGWSWLFAPYYWHYSGRAIGLTRVTALDGVCLRGKCEADQALGYAFLKRFSQKAVRSLDLTRMQLLDLLSDVPKQMR